MRTNGTIIDVKKWLIGCIRNSHISESVVERMGISLHDPGLLVLRELFEDFRILCIPSFQFVDTPGLTDSLNVTVSAVNQTLDAQRSPYAVAVWWHTRNPRLEDQCPCDLIGTRDAQYVLSVATEFGLGN